MKALPVIALDHPAALDAARVGHDAAALATARAAGLPVVGGVVLTTSWSSDDAATVDLVWRIVSHDGAIALSARPSPIGSTTLEPSTSVHSAAGLLSAARAARATRGADVPVLVQADTRSDWRGVLLTDDRGRRVSEAIGDDVLPHLTREVLGRLDRLADRLATVLGRAADFEFAVAGGQVRVMHVREETSRTTSIVAGELFHTAA
jgi:hypothetical protein